MRWDCDWLDGSEESKWKKHAALVEKNRPKMEKWRLENAAILEWHDWFAWHPVEIGRHDCRWLETIERRAEGWTIFAGVYRWHYRAKENA